VISAAPWRSSNVVELIVDAVIASLNVAVIGAVVETPVAPPSGVVLSTIGGVSSGMVSM
jgi:hypothetical protein